MNGRTALYHIYDDTDLLLYIGISKHFGIRWQKHAFVQPWWPQARRQTIYWYDTRDEALDAEALAIFTEQPKHNVMHRKQAQRLKRIQQQVEASPVELPERQHGYTKITISPEVTPADLAMMEMIDQLFPDSGPVLTRQGAYHVADWES